MHRGSTPTMIFEFDRDISNLDYLEIDFSQKGEVILRKFRPNCRIDGNRISVYIPEEQTLMFQTYDGYNAYVEVQIKIGISNKRLITDIMQVIIKPILQDGKMDTDAADSPLSPPTISVKGNKIVALVQQEPINLETYTESETSVLASDLDENLKPQNIKKGVTIFGVEGKVGGDSTQSKNVKLTKNGRTLIKPDDGYDSLATVLVDVDVDVEQKLQRKEKTITQNGDVKFKADPGYTGLDEVVVHTDVKPHLQDKVATQNGIVEADPGYNGLRKVDVRVQSSTANLQDKTIVVDNNGTRTVSPDIGFDGLSKVDIITRVTPVLQSKAVNISRNGKTTVNYDPEYGGLQDVDINVNVKPNLQRKTVTKNGIVKPSEVYDGLSEVEVNVQPKLQEKTATVNGEVVRADDGFDGLSQVKVQVADKPIKLEEKTITLTENNAPQDVVPSQGFDGLSKVTVEANVKPHLQEKTVTENGTVVPDYGYDGLSQVNVEVQPPSSGLQNYLDGEKFGNVVVHADMFGGTMDRLNNLILSADNFEAIVENSERDPMPHNILGKGCNFSQVCNIYIKSANNPTEESGIYHPFREGWAEKFHINFDYRESQPLKDLSFEEIQFDYGLFELPKEFTGHNFFWNMRAIPFGQPIKMCILKAPSTATYVDNNSYPFYGQNKYKNNIDVLDVGFNMEVAAFDGSYTPGTKNHKTLILRGSKKLVIKDPEVNGQALCGAGEIYVPDNLLAAYKADPHFSASINDFKPLSSLPAEKDYTRLPADFWNIK